MATPTFFARLTRRFHADHAMLIAVVANFAFALALGEQFPQRSGAFAFAGAALAFGVGCALLRREWLTRAAMVISLTALIALQIHLSGGQIEFHFNLFVTMSLLLVYRDWRPIVLMSALVTMHHFGFDRLLQAGIPVYCLSEPDPSRILLHVAFVAGQCLMLCGVAITLHRRAIEAKELEFLVNAMGRSGPIRLNLAVMRVDTEAGLRLKHVQQRMAEAVKQVRETARGLQEAAQASADMSNELTERAQRTVGGLKDAAVSLDQIGVIARSSTEASNEAKTMSATAAGMADKGGELVRNVVATMSEIEASSRRINDIIGVIDGIAFQTNILALNAAVEANRAGEQGRGFAVVASEVRSLARRSADAAKEIRALIAASSQTVARGAELVSGAGETMNALMASVRRVGDLFANITGEAEDHAQGLEMVSASMNELGTLTQGNLAAAERSDQTSRALQAEVDRLAEVLSAFRLGDDGPRAITPSGPSPVRPIAAAAPSRAPRATPPQRPARPPATTPAPALADESPATPTSAAPRPSAPPAAPPAGEVEFF